MNLAGFIPSTTAKAASSEHHQGSSFGDFGLDRQVHAVRDNANFEQVSEISEWCDVMWMF